MDLIIKPSGDAEHVQLLNNYNYEYLNYYMRRINKYVDNVHGNLCRWSGPLRGVRGMKIPENGIFEMLFMLTALFILLVHLEE